MKESIEEFGTVAVVCVIGGVALLGLGALIKDTGLIANLMDAYTNFVYGPPLV